MQDESKRREARMMEAVAGLGGRNAPSSEVDVRLGVVPANKGYPKWLVALVSRLGRVGRVRSITARVHRAAFRG